MEKVGPIGVYEVFVPGAKIGQLYKFFIVGAHGEKLYKADPYANEAELRPGTASRITDITDYKWKDATWIKNREKFDEQVEPMAIYEVHPPGILLCIPYYIIMKQLNLIDSYIGLILMYCSFTLPFAIWNTCAFFISIPWELEEAARIDGCSRLKSFFHVIIHVAKPGLFVTALFCFMTSWDEYMYASIFINTTSKKTIQVGMQDFVGQYSVDWGLLMSAVVISLIPILIFFALVQKNLVQGLSAGAVKG